MGVVGNSTMCQENQKSHPHVHLVIGRQTSELTPNPLGHSWEENPKSTDLADPSEWERLCGHPAFPRGDSSMPLVMYWRGWQELCQCCPSPNTTQRGAELSPKREKESGELMLSYPCWMGCCWRKPFLSSSTQTTEGGGREEIRKRQIRISKGIEGMQSWLTAQDFSRKSVHRPMGQSHLTISPPSP